MASFGLLSIRIKYESMATARPGGDLRLRPAGADKKEAETATQ
jgi:hypothetical protein